jgi:hypothetical protein
VYALIEPEPSGRPRRTAHTEGPSLEEQYPLPWPRVVVIEVRESDAMLYRYSPDGSFGGDTWHESDQDAREAAEWEYEGLISDWRAIPSDAFPMEFAIERASDGT